MCQMKKKCEERELEKKECDVKKECEVNRIADCKTEKCEVKKEISCAAKPCDKPQHPIVPPNAKDLLQCLKPTT